MGPPQQKPLATLYLFLVWYLNIYSCVLRIRAGEGVYDIPTWQDGRSGNPLKCKRRNSPTITTFREHVIFIKYILSTISPHRGGNFILVSLCHANEVISGGHLKSVPSEDFSRSDFNNHIWYSNYATRCPISNSDSCNPSLHITSHHTTARTTT